MKRSSTTIFTTVTTQGGLFPPEFLQRICDLDKSIRGVLPADFHLPEHRRISEEANRAWSVLQGDWKAFRKKVDELGADDPAIGLTRDQWLLPLFDQLGYGRLKKAGSTQIDGKDYPVSHFWEHSPIHLVGWNLDLDKRASGVAGAARFAPHGMVQEFLNRSEDHLWGFVSNGRQLRILRDNISMTRQSYVEFDLVAMMDGECFSDFVLLWLLCHSSRVEVVPDEEGKPRTPHACWLERWSREAETQGARLLDHLREGVEDTIRVFGSGFLSHPSNLALREKLRAGELDKQDYYRQILRLVYRLIFLFVAEDRDLLHLPAADGGRKKIYFDHYSTQRIRRIAETKRGTQHRDLWESLKLLFNWLCDDQGCEPLGLTPLGGFLFSDTAMPDLVDSQLANSDLLTAIRSLAVTHAGGPRRPVDYRNLGAEELGSIYESLLEMHPDLNLDAATFKLDVAAGNERKSTGSYYTPKPLVNCLLDSALDPVVEQCLKNAKKRITNNQEPITDLQEKALLSLKVCDPACGSGHFLIGAAHRIAKHLASVRSGDSEPSPEATRHALRDVITHCIYGVDINPMSVELCKVSLWMEAMEPGKPLGFLDHHIKCGNSLLGTTPALLSRGIPDAAFNPIEGDEKNICTALKKRNKEERDAKFDDLFASAEATWSYQHAFEDAVKEVDSLPDDDIQSLEKKQLAYEQFLQSTSYTGGKRLHDAWCAAFVQPKTTKNLEPATLSLEPAFITQQVIREMQIDPNRCPKAQQELIDRLAAQYKFFHWHIEFPDVFQPLENFAEKDSKGWNGGFDCLLGNPPWERIKLQEKEWFAARDPDIATASNAAARKRLIYALIENNPSLHAAFLQDRRQAEAESTFTRNSGRFPLCGRGDVNTYTLFAETFKDCISKAGRSGVIVPSGICTDDTTKFFFQNLVESKALVSLFDFENRKKIFAAVDSRMKFCLLTMGGAGAMPPEGAMFSFFALDVEDLKDVECVFTLSADDIELINPNTRTCPIFRTRRDAELTKAIYRRVPVLIREARDGQPEQNPWGISFMRMFDMSNDSHLFHTRDQLEQMGYELEGNIFTPGHAEPLLGSGSDADLEVGAPDNSRFLPLYEAKMFHHFNHRFGSYEDLPEDSSSTQLPDIPLERLQNPDYAVLPRYWVLDKEVWMRASNAPLRIKNAIKEGNQDALKLALVQLLFAHWIKNDRSEGVYSLWCSFVKRYPLARELAPTQLGLCGDNPALLKPSANCNSSAEAIDKVEDPEQGSTAWYELDDSRVDAYIELFSEYRIPGSIPEEDSLADYAYAVLQANMPNWFCAFRDITNTTNERTAIFCIIPPVAVGNNAPLMLFENTLPVHELLAAALSSLAFDSIARKSVGGTHMNFFILKQLPTPSQEQFFENCPFNAALSWNDYLLPLCRELYAVNKEITTALEIDHPFIWNEERRFEIRCELDAAFFHLYGIDNKADVDYIMETFPIVKRKDEKQYGTYRTKNRILEIYREMAQCMSSSESLVSSFMSHLNPPPGPPCDADGNFIPMSDWDPQNWPPHIHPPREI